MQKYEKPMIEIVEQEENDIITLSVGTGDGPTIGVGGWTN